MSGPLEGVKVVELGLWVAGPSCAAILRDWGAEVIKIEPPQGDPFRGLFASVLGSPIQINPPFEVDNRGKRSVVLNLETEQARDIANRLIEQADVFVTNMRPRALEDFALDYAALSERLPRLIYCQLTGYGPDGPDRDRAAYDIGAFWSRAGVAAALTPPGAQLPQQRGGMGDHMAGMAAAGAVCAALLARQRTGRGQRVAVSLFRTGVYMMGWDIGLAMRLGMPIVPYDRQHAINPIITCYRSSDERWFWLLLLQADRHWPDLCRAIDREDLLTDERFADIERRRSNGPALVALLDEVFATKGMAEWARLFDENNVWWAPVNTLREVVDDPISKGAGAFADVEGPDGPVSMVSTPADFSETAQAPRGLAPELGQHTEEVLLELGYDWEGIIALKESGVIP
jgi:crotonobetainyl-CoA:carnitine CoA-transferase CaiB-like acyl-CoA transferase